MDSQIQVSNSSESSSSSFLASYAGSHDTIPASTSAPRSNIHFNTNTQTQFQTPAAGAPAFHPTIFFYRPPNEFCHYYINCKEISYGTVTYLLNKSSKGHDIQPSKDECIIYYQQQYDNRVYQLSCQIASPILINNCLNKNILGIELQQQTVEQENLAFTLDQRENLETHLLQYLSNYLLN
jgi:hypothetical protein